MSKQQTKDEDWEKEFDSKFISGELEIESGANYDSIPLKAIKSFIRKTLSQARAD